MRRENRQSEGKHPETHDRQKSDDPSNYERDPKRNADEARVVVSQTPDHPPAEVVCWFRGGCIVDLLRKTTDLIVTHIASLEFHEDAPNIC